MEIVTWRVAGTINVDGDRKPIEFGVQLTPELMRQWAASFTPAMAGLPFDQPVDRSVIVPLNDVARSLDLAVTLFRYENWNTPCIRAQTAGAYVEHDMLSRDASFGPADAIKGYNNAALDLMLAALDTVPDNQFWARNKTLVGSAIFARNAYAITVLDELRGRCSDVQLSWLLNDPEDAAYLESVYREIDLANACDQEKAAVKPIRKRL